MTTESTKELQGFILIVVMKKDILKFIKKKKTPRRGKIKSIGKNFDIETEKKNETTDILFRSNSKITKIVFRAIKV